MPALAILILFLPAPVILTLFLPALITLILSLLAPAPSILTLFLLAPPNIIYNLIGRRLPHNLDFININNLNIFNIELKAEFKQETYFNEKFINSIFKI